MGNFIVYKHTSPSGKCYVGITSQAPECRWGNEDEIGFISETQKETQEFMSNLEKFI